MNNLNSVLIQGGIASDPQFRVAPNGTQVCAFTIKSNHFHKGDCGMEKEVNFFDVEARSKQAEYCHTFGHKGIGVRVVGRLKQERWNGDDGKFHSKVFIVAEHVELMKDWRIDGEDASD